MTDDPDLSPEDARAELEKLAKSAGSGPLDWAGWTPSTPDEIPDFVPAPFRMTQDQYKLLLEQIPVITFLASFEHGLREVYVSPQIESILGYTAEEWLKSAMLWLERLHPDDRDRWNQDFAPTVMYGEPFHGTYRFIARNGEVKWLLGDARIVKDAKGQPLFVQGVGLDVTELKRTEEALREAQQALRKANVRLRSEVQKESAEELVGSSEPMEKLRAEIRRFASSGSTALIRGESGTGKELVARALHYSGPRAQKPFVDVNCAALPESLLDSELFGHEKGAFTDAKEQKKGLFELAEGGTVFLDEIGDMSPALQTKVLKVLEGKPFRRIGGKQEINPDARVVAATNRPLEELIREKQFREDLYFRINILTIQTPPLRERKDDIPELAEHFMARANRAEKREVKEISKEAKEALQAHPWPGNVRELEHVIGRAVLSCDGQTIGLEHLPDHLLPEAGPRGLRPAQTGEEGLVDAIRRVEQPVVDATLEKKVGLVDAIEHLERSMIVAALDRTGWVKAQAARDLRLNERVLSYKMNTLGIKKPEE